MASPIKGLALTQGDGYARLLRGQGKLRMAQLASSTETSAFAWFLYTKSCETLHSITEQR